MFYARPLAAPRASRGQSSAERPVRRRGCVYMYTEDDCCLLSLKTLGLAHTPSAPPAVTSAAVSAGWPRRSLVVAGFQSWRCCRCRLRATPARSSSGCRQACRRRASCSVCLGCCCPGRSARCTRDACTRSAELRASGMARAKKQQWKVDLICRHRAEGRPEQEKAPEQEQTRAAGAHTVTSPGS